MKFKNTVVGTRVQLTEDVYTYEGELGLPEGATGTVKGRWFNPWVCVDWDEATPYTYKHVLGNNMRLVDAGCIRIIPY